MAGQRSESVAGVGRSLEQHFGFGVAVAVAVAGPVVVESDLAELEQPGMAH